MVRNPSIPSQHGRISLDDLDRIMTDRYDSGGGLKAAISAAIIAVVVAACFQYRYYITDWLRPYLGNVVPEMWIMAALVLSAIVLPIVNAVMRSWRISSLEVLLLMIISFALVGAFIGYIFGFFYMIDEYPLWQHAMLAMMAVGAVAAVACLLVPDPKFSPGNGFVEVDEDTDPRLHAIFSDLCGKAGVEPPPLYIWNAKSYNALAFEKYRKRQGIIILAPMLDIMDDDELEGILGHELSHLIHRDSAVMSVASICARTLAAFSCVMGILALISSAILGSAGSSKSSKSGDAGMLYLLMVVALIPIVIVGAVLWISVPLAMVVMVPGISRTREYGADEGSAMITGKPLALASALLKLDEANRRIRTSLRPGVTADLMISDPFSGSRMKLKERLMSTHPSIADRVIRLEALNAKMKG